MPIERLSPDAILAATNLSGGVAAIQDDPDAPDGAWLTAVTTDDTSLRVSFPTASGDVNPGFAAQTFRLIVRKSAAGGNEPTLDLDLYENGSLFSALVSGLTVSSETGQLLDISWSASGLSSADGSGVELLVSGSRSSGSPSSRRSVEIGAIEWLAEYQTSNRSGSIVTTGQSDLASLSAQLSLNGLFGAAGVPDNAGISGNLRASILLAATDAPDVAMIAGSISNPAAAGPVNAVEASDASEMVVVSESRANLSLPEIIDSLTAAGAVGIAGAMVASAPVDLFGAIGSGQFGTVAGAAAFTERPDLASSSGVSVTRATLSFTPSEDVAGLTMRTIAVGNFAPVSLTDGAVFSGFPTSAGALARTDPRDDAGFSGAGAQVGGSISAIDQSDTVLALAGLNSNGLLLGAEPIDASGILAQILAKVDISGIDPGDTATFSGTEVFVSALVSAAESNDAADLSAAIAATGVWNAVDERDSSVVSGLNGAAFSQIIVENTCTGSASWSQIAGRSSQHRINI